MDLRHKIAHGANTNSTDLAKDNIRNNVNFITWIAGATLQTISTTTALLSQTQALEYSFTQTWVVEIITYASSKPDEIITLDEIKSLGSSAQGNHNKLCYEPWGLLEHIDRNSRRLTRRMIQFINNELALPIDILVFDNKEAVEKPGTSYVMFSDLMNISM